MNDADEGKQKESHQEAQGYLDDLEEQVFHLMHDIPESVHKAFRQHRRSAFQRHPFIFSTLGLIGLVATWKGFDGIIDNIGYLNNNPETLLLIGLVLLLTTGRLYRHLDKQE